MEPTGLHLLLTYQCTLECDHCFVWGSPWQNGVMTTAQVRQLLKQARDQGSVRSVYFEGGEPFLYYATMLEGVRSANEMGFSVGVVSNAYWATSIEDAKAWLRPFVGRLSDLSVSSDLFHWSPELRMLADNAVAAANELDIPIGTIAIAPVDEDDAAEVVGQTPPGDSRVMFRGRAHDKLAPGAAKHRWSGFDTCPYENLTDPGRLHVDPFGHLHLCQGISAGTAFESPLEQLLSEYDPHAHPIVGPLLDGGPAELARRYDVPHRDAYADACELCFDVRARLRDRFPAVLAPDQMYGVVSDPR